MTNGGQCDALFVVNRRSDHDAIAAICRREKLRRIAYLSPHAPFATERATLAAAVPGTTVEFHLFADHFDDAALVAIDDGATRELLAARTPAWRYIDAHEDLTLTRKNAAVRDRFLREFPARRIYVDDGLGVAAKPWKESGAISLGRNRPKRLVRLGLRRRLEAVRDAWPGRRWPVMLLEDGATRYFFSGGFRRLKIRPGVVARRVDWRRVKPAPAACFAAVAQHDYTPAVHALGLPVRLFVDGFLPSNYPRSYFDGYDQVEFVCPDPFSAQLIESFGLRALRPPGFIEVQEFAAPAPPAAIRTIVLLLNHAGDWSALIHRSDTDLLVAAFAELARALPDIRCVVRPHPGMDGARHEGAGATARLGAFVAASALANLEMSTVSLPADLERGDLFISEYSATLIEAWRLGRLGLSVNLTRRRSLIQDFTNLGFAHVTGERELHRTVRATLADPASLAAQQAAAASRYNRLLRDYVGR